jgi:hypothetical protein
VVPGGDPLDPTAKFFFGGDMARDLALCVVDDHTFVMATPSALQTFLKAKGKPKFLTEPPVEGEEPAAGGGARRQAVVLPARWAAAVPRPDGRRRSSDARRPRPTGRRRPSRTDGLASPGAGGPPRGAAAAPASLSYMTILQPLARVLDKVEAGKRDGHFQPGHGHEGRRSEEAGEQIAPSLRKSI